MKRDIYVVDKEISKEMEEYAKSDFEYRYENIADIDYSTANNIEELIMQQDCPMYMKFELKKYYFNLKFEAPPDMQETIQEAWNLNMFGIVDWLLDHAGEESVFDSIKTENKWDNIFTAPANRKQVKMSADVVERIFKEFKFRTLSKTSSKNQIFKSIMNTAFKANIIKSFMDDTEHISYYINGDLEPYLQPLQKLCKNYAKGFADRAWIAEDEPLDCLE